MEIPYLPLEHIESAAEELLQRALGSSSGDSYVDLDVVVYDYLCEEDGLSFNDEGPLSPEQGEPVLGKTLPFKGKILIHGPLKGEGPIGRYRFTVAHEIGHWVLHRPLVLADAQQLSLLDEQRNFEFTSLNRSVFPTIANGQHLAPEEWQANRFASYLLVGSKRLREEFAGRFGHPPRIWRDGPTPSFPTVRLLARDLASRKVRGKPPLHATFGLSIEAMSVTLLERDLVVRD